MIVIRGLGEIDCFLIVSYVVDVVCNTRMCVLDFFNGRW